MFNLKVNIKRSDSFTFSSTYFIGIQINVCLPNVCATLLLKAHMVKILEWNFINLNKTNQIETGLCNRDENDYNNRLSRVIGCSAHDHMSDYMMTLHIQIKSCCCRIMINTWCTIKPAAQHYGWSVNPLNFVDNLKSDSEPSSNEIRLRRGQNNTEQIFLTFWMPAEGADVIQDFHFCCNPPPWAVNCGFAVLRFSELTYGLQRVLRRSWLIIAVVICCVLLYANHVV